MINWRVRIRNRDFWIAIIPATLLLVQMLLGLFGINLIVDGLTAKLLDIVNTAFLILGILGIVNDPTTHSLADSIQAMGYDVPKKSR